MSTGQIILGIALFAAATAILYVWGLKKSMSQQEDLERSLMSACGSRVVKHLKSTAPSRRRRPRSSSTA